MEEENFQIDIRHFIFYKEDFLDKKYLNILMSWVKKSCFETSGLISDGNKTEHTIDKSIRNTDILGLDHLNESLTNVKHARYLRKKIFLEAENYLKIKKLNHLTNLKRNVDVQILKYEKGGFYNFHTDYHWKAPRNLSIVIQLNDEFEGGHLSFANLQKNLEHNLIMKKNSICIFPSNFIYAHTVKPVTEGTRYSCVAWIA